MGIRHTRRFERFSRGEEMILISHRGNVMGPEPQFENRPDFIDKALDLHYNVEIDVWNVLGRWALGHDEPQYEIDVEFLQQPGVWCHLKNIEALKRLSHAYGVHYFWHQGDDFTLTSKGYVWAYPDKYVEGCIAQPTIQDRGVFLSIDPVVWPVLPVSVTGICSDYISFWKEGCDASK